jgi:hypothetical protein
VLAPSVAQRAVLALLKLEQGLELQLKLELELELETWTKILLPLNVWFGCLA